VNKNTASAQRKTSAATLRQGKRKKIVVFNLSPLLLEEAADDDYNTEEGIDYELYAELDNITLNTEGLSLTSKESAIDSIYHHGKISDSFDKEDSSEEENDDQISCLSVPRVKSQAKEDNMGFRVQYSHLVEYPNNSVYIIVYFIGGCSPSFFVSNKDEKSVWMVESTPSVVYDAIEVYKQQGLSETSGHAMLLQAEMNKKKQASKEKMAKYDIDLGSLALGEIKNAHRLYKLSYKVESMFYDMSGKHVMDKVYGDKGRNGTYYAFIFLKNKVMLPALVHQRHAPIMTNNTRQRDEEGDVTARSREAKRASEARARNQDTQIAQMHTTMLQQQEQMRLHQQEMLRQCNEMATMAHYQGNGNNNVNFGQQVLDAAGLAFGDASIPDNFNLVGDDSLSQDYGSPKGDEMDADDL
jgi:hypothetical protein